jgi:hypothetical protein
MKGNREGARTQNGQEFLRAFAPLRPNQNP